MSTINRSSQNNAKAILRAECRACLKNDGILPIFGDEARPDISMEMETFSGIKLGENDDFPKFICEDCFRLLQSAIRFRKFCKRSDTTLKRRKKERELQENFVNGNVVHETFHGINTEVLIEKNEPITLDFEQQTVTTTSTATQVDTYNLQKTEMNTDNIMIEYVDNTNMNQIKIDFVSVDMAEPSDNIIPCPEAVTYVKPESEKNFNYVTPESVKNVIDVKPESGKNFDSHGDSEDTHMNNEPSIDSDDEPLKKSVSPKKKPDFFSCKYCNKSFQTLDHYEQHRTTVEHKRNYVMSFLPKNKRPGEKSKKTAPKNHPCKICNIPFNKRQYIRHMLKEHKIQVDLSSNVVKKECNICYKMFHPAFIGAHMKRKHGEEQEIKPKVKFECPICNKLFSKHFYPLHLQRHKQGDTKNFVCDQCGKKFFFKSSFFTHRLIHTNSLPHKCDFCPYRGRTKELLKIHCRTHTGDYPYKCNQCGAKCITKSNLNSHMRRHKGPVDFICDACNRGFYSKTDLDRHIEVSHYGVKNHICSLCGAAFGYRHGLMSHLRKVHKRPKGSGKPKAVYLQLAEKGLLPAEQ